MIIFPLMQRKLDIMGENIKLARLRRKLNTSQVAERAGVSLSTLDLIEKGSADVMMGDYLNVLKTLRLDSDIYTIASNDELGRKLQDIELLNRDSTANAK